MRLFRSKPSQRSLVRNCEHYLETIMSEETTSEQLAEIEGQPEPIQLREGRWRTRSGAEVSVSAMPTDHDRFLPAYPWWDAARGQTWTSHGRYHSLGESLLDLVTYLGAIEPEPEPQAQPAKTQEQPAETQEQPAAYTPLEGWRLVPLSEALRGGDEYHQGLDRYIRRIEPEPEPQPKPAVQVREGRWRTQGGDIRNVTARPEGDGRRERWPWWDAQYRHSWMPDGRYYSGVDNPLDLVEYLGSFEPEPERGRNGAGTEPEPDAETIGELKEEAHVLNMEIGGLERQLAVVKEELKTAAAVCVRLQIELDAAQQVPADSPQLRQLRLDLAEVTRDRDDYRRAHELWVQDANTAHERTRAMAVEAIIEWLEPFRGCNSPALALLLIEALPHIMRSLTGLAEEEIE